MRTYRELLRAPEFPALFATVSVQVAAQTVSGIALATLVYGATGSALLSALSMFGASFAQVVGAATLLSAADRLPPRAALAGLALFTALTTALLAVPALPIGAVLGVVLLQGLVASIGGGVRFGLLSDIVAAEGYLLGRSLLNMSVGAMQIAGFAGGGLLLAVASPSAVLLGGAGLSLLAAAVARFGLVARPPRAAGRASVRATWRGNRALLGDPARRAVYIGLWVPNGLIVGCEALFVPYSPHAAAALFVAAALGMLAGDALAGRVLPARWRRPLTSPVQLLLAVPYLAFALHPPLWAAAGLAAVASVGYCGSLLLQDRLVELTPPELRGHSLGLHSSGMFTMQAVGATLAGAVAQSLAPGPAMAVMAVASITVSVLLVRPFRAPVGPRPAVSPSPAASRT
ncbi:MFS transporter [Dactylosporangium vinaceum]|uniref:MFS transporter n=1 Tax=Dactylosporangium vinaceum TaxID=53362 RepID=A0ABV5M474_9ACTN|nr:MFS transporter [Dactylosporangium vinaceum]UAB93441.1 MFS transporter [Dactylosporangium vinaceum]